MNMKLKENPDPSDVEGNIGVANFRTKLGENHARLLIKNGTPILQAIAQAKIEEIRNLPVDPEKKSPEDIARELIEHWNSSEAVKQREEIEEMRIVHTIEICAKYLESKGVEPELVSILRERAEARRAKMRLRRSR